jgi:urea transport system ATP-binding protein
VGISLEDNSSNWPLAARWCSNIILKLNEVAGPTIVLVEQRLPFARRVASDFRILEKGRCVASGPIGELTDDLVRPT